MADTIAEAQRPAETFDMQALTTDIAALRADLAGAAERARDAAAEDAAHGARKVADIASDAVNAVGDYRDMLADRIRAHPFASVGIALAAGFVLASMSRR